MLSLVVGVTRAYQRQPGTCIFMFCYFYGNHLMYWMKIIYFLCDKDLRKQQSFFAIGSSLAVRCCRPSLELSEHLSGNQVCVFSCYVICLAHIWCIEWNTHDLYPKRHHNDIILFRIEGSLAVRCCGSSLEKPEFPSGSQIRVFSCSSIFIVKHLMYLTYDFYVIKT